MIEFEFCDLLDSGAKKQTKTKRRYELIMMVLSQELSSRLDLNIVEAF